MTEMTHEKHKEEYNGSNICEYCDEQPHLFSFLVADTGKCSLCGKTAECWDKELIGMYHAIGLSDNQISSRR